MSIENKLDQYLRLLKEESTIIRELKKIKGVDFAFEEKGDIFVEVDNGKIDKVMKQINHNKNKLGIKSVSKKEEDLLIVKVR